MKAFRTKEKDRERIANIRSMPPVKCLKCGNIALVCRVHLINPRCPECGGEEVVEQVLSDLEHPDMPFNDWLSQQRGRQDEVGEFADAAAEMPDGMPKGSFEGWMAYFESLGFTQDDAVVSRLYEAHYEYYTTVVLA
jgi:hypothetical protein